MNTTDLTVTKFNLMPLEFKYIWPSVYYAEISSLLKQ